MIVFKSSALSWNFLSSSTFLINLISEIETSRKIIDYLVKIFSISQSSGMRHFFLPESSDYEDMLIHLQILVIQRQFNALPHRFHDSRSQSNIDFYFSTFELAKKLLLVDTRYKFCLWWTYSLIPFDQFIIKSMCGGAAKAFICCLSHAPRLFELWMNLNISFPLMKWNLVDSSHAFCCRFATNSNTCKIRLNFHINVIILHWSIILYYLSFFMHFWSYFVIKVPHILKIPKNPSLQSSNWS